MNSIRLANELCRIAKEISKIPPFPGDKSKSIEADNDQKRELENILGPEELYGGGIVEAWFEPSAKIIRGKKALVGGTLYVYSGGDFGEDEDGNFVNGGWLKFNASKVVDYYCYNEDDGEDFIGWFRSDVISTSTIDAQIVNVFDYDIMQWLEYEFGWITYND